MSLYIKLKDLNLQILSNDISDNRDNKDISDIYTIWDINDKKVNWDIRYINDLMWRSR